MVHGAQVEVPLIILGLLESHHVEVHSKRLLILARPSRYRAVGWPGERPLPQDASPPSLDIEELSLGAKLLHLPANPLSLAACQERLRMLDQASEAHRSRGTP